MCVNFFKGLERLVEPLKSTCTMKVKQNSVKQEYEKQDELKRSAFRAVAALLTIPDAGECRKSNAPLRFEANRRDIIFSYIKSNVVIYYKVNLSLLLRRV